MIDKLKNLRRGKSESSPEAPARKRFTFKHVFFGRDKIPAPTLLIISLVLLVLFKIAISIFPDKVGGYLGVVILLTVIFFIPAYLYYKFTKRGRLSSVLNELKIKAPKIDHIFLLFFGAVLISVCVFYINLLFRLREGYTYGFYLYNTFFTGKLPSPDTPLFPIIAFALVPAMCEEFMFRGIFHASYEKQGFMSAAITSSIMFALVSLDIRTFISNFALGLFLSFILYLTRSLVSCFIVNFLFKCFMLFFGTNLQSYVLSSSNKAVFFAATIGTMLISCAVFAFETAKIFKQNSKGEHPLPKLTAPTKRVCFERTASNLSTVSITICVAIFIIAIFI